MFKEPSLAQSEFRPLCYRLLESALPMTANYEGLADDIHSMIDDGTLDFHGVAFFIRSSNFPDAPDQPFGNNPPEIRCAVMATPQRHAGTVDGWNKYGRYFGAQPPPERGDPPADVKRCIEDAIQKSIASGEYMHPGVIKGFCTQLIELNRNN